MDAINKAVVIYRRYILLSSKTSECLDDVWSFVDGDKDLILLKQNNYIEHN